MTAPGADDSLAPGIATVAGAGGVARAGAQFARVQRAMVEGHRLSAVAGLLATDVVEVEPGRVRLRYAVKPEFMHLGKAVQGGLVAAYADMAMATAAHTLCDDGEFLSTSQLSISFLAPVTAGPVYCEGRVVRRGRTIIFMEAVVSDAHGAEMARATSVGSPRKAKPAE